MREEAISQRSLPGQKRHVLPPPLGSQARSRIVLVSLYNNRCQYTRKGTKDAFATTSVASRRSTSSAPPEWRHLTAAALLIDYSQSSSPLTRRDENALLLPTAFPSLRHQRATRCAFCSSPLRVSCRLLLAVGLFRPFTRSPPCRCGPTRPRTYPRCAAITGASVP